MGRTSRWDFEVRVTTPDLEVLNGRVSAPADYMDGSLVEHLLGSIGAEAVRALREKGYLN